MDEIVRGGETLTRPPQQGDSLKSGVSFTNPADNLAKQ